jgi:hypothetical protein
MVWVSGRLYFKRLYECCTDACLGCLGCPVCLFCFQAFTSMYKRPKASVKLASIFQITKSNRIWPETKSRAQHSHARQSHLVTPSLFGPSQTKYCAIGYQLVFPASASALAHERFPVRECFRIRLRLQDDQQEEEWSRENKLNHNAGAEDCLPHIPQNEESGPFVVSRNAEFLTAPGPSFALGLTLNAPP